MGKLCVAFYKCNQKAGLYCFAWCCRRRCAHISKAKSNKTVTRWWAFKSMRVKSKCVLYQQQQQHQHTHNSISSSFFPSTYYNLQTFRSMRGNNNNKNTYAQKFMQSRIKCQLIRNSRKVDCVIAKKTASFDSCSILKLSHLPKSATWSRKIYVLST